MPRFDKFQAILAKIETTYGTDAVPTGAGNAVMVSNVKCNPLNASNVKRDLLRPYFGASEELVGSAFVEVSFDVEFQSSGSMVTPTIPAWDALVQACDFKAGVGSAGSRVEYDLLADYSLRKSLTIYYHDDGVLHKLLGAHGDMSLSAKVGERPVWSFKFQGLYGGVTATANPTATLTAWKTPLVVTDVNTGALTLGCTYATGALSGGTEYVSGGLEVSHGNAVGFSDMLGTSTVSGQRIDITDRQVGGKLSLELTAAQMVTFMASITANTLQSVGLVHGTTAGLKMLTYCPAVQLLNPQLDSKNGRRIVTFDARMLPVSGNDEIKYVAL